MNYISILNKKGGSEISRLEANSQDSNTLSIISEHLSLLPNAPITSNIYIGTGPPGYHLLYRNNDNVLSNVTLSGNFVFSSNGFLDIISGGVPGLITLQNTSGGLPVNNVSLINIEDSVWRRIGLNVSSSGVPNQATVNLKERLQIENIKLESSDAPGGFATSNTSLALYGDGAGGPPPYESQQYLTYYPGVEWYSQYSTATTNQVMYRRQNLNFSKPLSPFSSRAIWEFRTYNDTHVTQISQIGGIITPSITPPVDNPPPIHWEWKIHKKLHVNDPSDITNVNEQNKIIHSVDFTYGKTEILFAKYLVTINPIPNADTGFRFEPTNPNSVFDVPKGLFTFFTGGKRVWEADTVDMIVRLTNDTYNSSSIRELENTALQVRGGLWVKKKAFIGDMLELKSNASISSPTILQFYNSNFDEETGTGANIGSRFEYSTSNVLEYILPPGLTGGTQESRLSLSKIGCYLGDYVGGGAGTCQRVELLTKDGSVVMFDSNVNINGTFSSSLATQIWGGMDGTSISDQKPLLKGKNRNLTIVSNNTEIYSNIYDSNTMLEIIDSSSEIIFGSKSRNEDISFKVYSNNSTVINGFITPLKIETNRVDLGYNSQIYLDTRSFSNIVSNGIVNWSSLELNRDNINLLCLDTGGETSNTVIGSNSFVTINRDNDSLVGFRINTENYDNSFKVHDNKANFGVSVAFVSNSYSNHLNVSTTYKQPKGLVFNETANTLAYYNDATTDLINLATENDVFKFEYYQGYSNVLTLFSNTTTANIAFANVSTSNLNSNTLTQPPPEIAPPSNIISPIWSSGNGKIGSMLQFVEYEARGEIKTDIGTPTGTVDYLSYSWSSSGTKNISFQLPYAMGGTPSLSPDNNSTQGRLYAPRNGWITCVSIKFYSSSTLRQGGGGGYINLYKTFIGFYLASGNGASPFFGPQRPSSYTEYMRPTNVYRYLKSYQVSSDSPGTTTTIPGSIIVDLPSEDWVYVAKGDPLPYVSMVCPLTAGAGASPNGAGRFRIESNNSSDAAEIVTASVLFAMEPPEINTTRGDQRWETDLPWP